ncbi:MAG: PP0621 family protein [Janthinobacterium lividum]
MSRILFWIVLLGAGYWFWQRARTAVVRAAAEQGAAGRAARGAPHLIEPMVSCAYCGAHSPRSDTVALHRRHFCNDEHARRYAGGERADRQV